jgi:hypothetical protein
MGPGRKQSGAMARLMLALARVGGLSGPFAYCHERAVSPPSYGPGLPGPSGRSPLISQRGRPSAGGAGQARPVRQLLQLARVP